MADLPSVELVGGTGPAPAISNEGLAAYKQMLADPTFAREHPDHYAALKASVENALAITRQQLEPPDPRTPAQRYLDPSMTINPVVRDVVLREHVENKEPPDPERTAEALAHVGLTHKDALELAQHAVDQSKELAGRVRVEMLSAYALTLLARFGEHLRKQAAQRPTT